MIVLIANMMYSEHVLAYFGRYTHRVAIANSRLVIANETSVTFRWRDYRRGNAPKLMSLDPHEFTRRTPDCMRRPGASWSGWFAKPG